MKIISVFFLVVLCLNDFGCSADPQDYPVLTESEYTSDASPSHFTIVEWVNESVAYVHSAAHKGLLYVVFAKEYGEDYMYFVVDLFANSRGDCRLHSFNAIFDCRTFLGDEATEEIYQHREKAIQKKYKTDN